MDLQLDNARLETENKNLKSNVDYMKSLVNPARIQDPVECFLSDDVLSHPMPQTPSRSPSTRPEEDDSMMFEEFNWMRSDS